SCSLCSYLFLFFFFLLLSLLLPTRFPYTTLFRSLVIYLISSRNKSLLASVVDFIVFQLGEGTRRAATKRKTLFSLGINDAENGRSEEHTSELQSRFDLVCRLLLEKKNKPRHNASR